MKKFILPIIALFIDIALYSFRPELVFYQRYFQLLLYFSIVRILVFKTTKNNTLELKLIKWVLSVGLILPAFLIRTSSLIMDLFYIADFVMVVPILFYELFENGDKSIDKREVTYKMAYKGWDIIKVTILIILFFTFLIFGVYMARKNYGYISFLSGIFSANFFNQVLKMYKEYKNKKQ